MKLTDMLDEQLVSMIQSGISEATNTPLTVVELRDGQPYWIRPVTAKQNWAGFCESFRQIPGGDELCLRCDADAARRIISEGSGEARAYQCHMKLTEIGVGITVGGRAVAAFLTGQTVREGTRGEVLAAVEALPKTLPAVTPGALRFLREAAETMPQLSDKEVEILQQRLTVSAGIVSKLTADRYKLDGTIHALRAGPLSGIRGDVALLVRALASKGAEADAAEMCERLESHIARLVAEMDRLSFLAKMDTRAPPRYSFGHHPLGRVVRSVADELSGIAASRGIEIRIDRRIDSLPHACFDWDNVRLAFSNLLDNAVKYSFGGRAVEISGSVMGRHVAIKITNYGLGILPEEKERIFEPYTQGRLKDPRRFIPGMGLGLTIVREIVRTHGGDVVAWSSLFEDSRRATAARRGEHATQNGLACETSFTITIPIERR